MAAFPRAKLPTLALLALAVLLTAASARASVVLLTMDDLVQHSQEVVRVEVLDTSSAWGEWINGGEVIYTTARVRVTEAFFGAPPAEMEVTLIGGTIDGKTMYASGCPSLTVGEDAVLFLLPYDGKTWVTGLDNGKYTVEGEMAVNSGHQTARRVALATLRREIRDAVQRLGSDR